MRKVGGENPPQAHDSQSTAELLPYAGDVMNPHLRRWDEPEPVRHDSGELRWTRWLLGGRPADGRSGLSHWIVEPGARSTPPHSHVDDEEFMYVVAGSGLSWQDGKTYEITAGDVLFHSCWGPAHTVIAG